MARLKEPLNGGLVTGRDPSELQPGELQQTDECAYSPHDDGLHRAPARADASTSNNGAAVTGLRFCAFDHVVVTCKVTQGSTTLTPVTKVVPSVTTANGVTTITTTNSFVGVKVGSGITLTNIPGGTTVTIVNSPTTLTLSAAATGSATNTATFTVEDFDGVTAGAKIAGRGIPDGTTVSVKTDRITITMSNAATVTDNGTPVTFDADDLLIAQANSKYRKAVTGSAGTGITFSDLETVSEGTYLEAIHYNNRHVLLNGKNANRVLLSDGTTRGHGLLPVRETPKVTTGAGTWALQEGAGYYAYWTTEFDEVNQLESDFQGIPKFVNISSTSTKAIIERPTRVNATATHWRLYRSTKMLSTSDQAAEKEVKLIYPNGKFVDGAELRDDNTQLTMDDGGGATSSSTSTGAGAVGTVGVSSQGLTWQNTGNATGAPDGTNFATLTYAAGNPTDNTYVLLELTNFTVTTSISAPVTGITVTVNASRVGTGHLVVYVARADDAIGSGAIPATQLLGPTGAIGSVFTTVTPGVSDVFGGGKAFYPSTSMGANTLGSATDKWGRNKWDVSDFGVGRFVVRLYGSVPQSTGGTADKVSVDGVQVVVTHGQTQGTTVGADPTFGQDYPIVEVKPFNASIKMGRNGPPPLASTGDIFQGSLVLNDISDDSIVRYSFPTLLDSFPIHYFMNFDTKDQDKVTLIRTLGNVMIVGLQSQIYRVNYLPRQEDAEFDRGRAVELIGSSHGVAGGQAAAVFTLPSVGPVLAYANRYGIFITDGYRIRPLTFDLDWEALIDADSASKIILVDNPELQCLEMFYVHQGASPTTYPTRVLFLHYHPRHLKQGPGDAPMLKICGPQATTVGSACLSVLSGGKRLIYTGRTVSTFRVQYENAATGQGTPTWKTRKMFLAGFGNEWTLHEFYTGYTMREINQTVGQGIFTHTPTFYKTGAVSRDGSAKSPNSIATAGSGSYFKQRHLHKIETPDVAEGIEFTSSVAWDGSQRFSAEYHVIDGDGWGEEDSP